MAQLAQPWRVEPVEEDKPAYKPKDAIKDMLSVTTIMGVTGFVFAGAENALARQNIGAWGVFSKSGGTIVLFAAMGATYGFTKTAAANLREKEDPWNPAIAGFLAGAVGGLRYRTFPAVLGFGAGLAVLQGVFSVTGGRLSGFGIDPQMDEYERKEQMKALRRRPIQETIEQLGERSTMHGPNWRERRADRIKEKYGIDVPRQ